MRGRRAGRPWPTSATILVVALGAFSRPGAAAAEVEGAGRRIEWIVDGALAAAWLSMLPAFFAEPGDPVLGPRFRGPEDVEGLAAAADSGVVGRRYLGEANETVTDGELGWMILGTVGGALLVAGGLAPLLDGQRESGAWYGEQALAAFVGLVHALGGTLVLTEVAKVATGRLRPDFADRADRYYCAAEPAPVPYGPRCATLAAGGRLGEPSDAEALRRGRRSFWSGHSSLSFAAATYGALLVGGRMVWGRSSNAVTRALGLLLQGAALAAAGYVAASRVSDGVHHLEDVVVGSAVGITLACLGYFLHFETSGEVRRGVSLSAGPTATAGLALSGTF